jgi:hypothetical protein
MNNAKKKEIKSNFFEKNFFFFNFNEEDFYSFFNILRLKETIPTTIIIFINLFIFVQYIFVSLRKQYGFGKTGDSIMEYW